jgi:hypothetical protein
MYYEEYYRKARPRHKRYNIPMRQSLKRELGHLLFAMVVASIASPMCRAQVDIEASGVWAQGNTIVLLTQITQMQPPCKFFVPPGMPMLLVSNDAGRTWKRRGPWLEGYIFTFLGEKDGKVWIAGEHTAEGPSVDPFVFVPAEAGDHWQFHQIYEGPATIDRMGWGSNSELIAWIGHIEISTLEVEDVYFHHSRDGGKTWKELGLARRRKVAVGAEFRKLTKHMTPLCRAVNLTRGGFIVQRRDSDSSPWKTVSRFSPWRCREKNR